MKDKVIIALDVASRVAALDLVRQLRDGCGMFKVGSQLYMGAGPSVVREIVDSGSKVFLDLKFHDIPHTVTRAAVEAAGLGISMMTVHASGGRAMMQSAAREVHSHFADNSPAIVAVTVLTSFDTATLFEIGVEHPIEEQVRRLALLSDDCGMDGVVCSPRELGVVRRSVRSDFKIVTPGVRLPDQPPGDQHRTATPADAIAAGADYIVVGRPITGAPDPRAALARLVQSMAGS